MNSGMRFASALAFFLLAFFFSAIEGLAVQVEIFFETQADDFFGGALDPLISIGNVCGPGRVNEGLDIGTYQIKAFFRPDVKIAEVRVDTYDPNTGGFLTSVTFPAASSEGAVGVTLIPGNDYVIIIYVSEGSGNRANVASACGSAETPPNQEIVRVTSRSEGQPRCKNVFYPMDFTIKVTSIPVGLDQQRAMLTTSDGQFWPVNQDVEIFAGDRILVPAGAWRVAINLRGEAIVNLRDNSVMTLPCEEPSGILEVGFLEYVQREYNRGLIMADRFSNYGARDILEPEYFKENAAAQLAGSSGAIEFTLDLTDPSRALVSVQAGEVMIAPKNRQIEPAYLTAGARAEVTSSNVSVSGSNGRPELPPVTGDGSLERFDFNENNLLEDIEFFAIVDAWIGGSIENQLFFQAVDIWVAQSPIGSASLSPKNLRVQTRLSNNLLTFSASRSELANLKIEVFDQSGEQIFAGYSGGASLSWNLQLLSGRPVANGIYFYRVSGVWPGGDVVRSEVKKLLILR